MRVVVTILVLCLTASAIAQDRKEKIEQWCKDLGSRDADVRSSARLELMGLKMEEIPLLKEIVVKQRDALGRDESLHEIVTYVHFRGALLQRPRLQSGFLGVNFSRTAIEQPDGNNGSVPVGVMVSPLKGFIAYRYLSDGDIIRAVGASDDMKPIRDTNDLVTAIRAIRPGTEIRVQVQRGTRDVSVRFPLDARIADEESLLDTLAELESDAEKYWDENFRALFPVEAE